MKAREELLGELSHVLGVEVSGVVRDHDAEWHLRLPCTPDICNCRMAIPFDERIKLPRTWQPPFPHGQWQRFGKSGCLRDPKRLNPLARKQGRLPYLPPLAAEDGKRIVRLVFDIYAPREKD